MPSSVTDFIELFSRDDLKVVLSPFGGSLYQVYFQGEKMCLTPKEEVFLRPNGGYNGQFVSPWAGRIKNGQVGGYLFSGNEGTTALHSCDLGTAFRVLSYSESAEPGKKSITFRFECEIGGAHIRQSVTYAVYEAEPRLDIDYECHSDKLFPINPTTHVYWSLGEKAVEEIDLLLPSREVMRYDRKNIPLEFVEVDEKMDFRKARQLDMSFDHAFLLEDGHITATGKRFSISIQTDASHVVLYTGEKGGFTLEFVNNPLLTDEQMRKDVVIKNSFLFGKLS